MARILTCYYKPKPGGYCKRLFMSINALLENGHDVHYLAVGRFPVEHPKCHFHRFPWPLKYTDNLFFWAVFISLSPLLLAYLGVRYRIEKCYAFNTTYGFLLQPVRILRSIPLSIFLRADVIETHILKKRSAIIIEIERMVEAIAIWCTHVYGVSQTLIDNVISRHRIFRPQSHGVLRNNITLPENEPFNSQRAIFEKPLRLACAGIFESRKNQTLLLYMMKELKSLDIVLYLFGCGPDEDKLRRLINELNIEQSVKVMGWVERDVIREYADVMLTPSLHEGAPNIVLEALAYDIPVFASDLPEHREVLPARSLFPVNEYLVWAKEISRIYHDPQTVLQEIIAAQLPFKNKLVFDWGQAITKLFEQ